MLASPMELLITSSVVILAVVLLRLVLRDRLSRQLRYALWLAVVLRLLVPLSPPAASSVMNLPAAERLAAFQPVRVEVFTGPETPADTLPEAPADGTLQEAAPARTMEPLALIWLAGAAVTGGWLLAVNLRFARALHRERRAFSLPEGAQSPLPVYLAPSLPTPCLFGFPTPAVYLTPEAAADGRTLRHVLTHELCHYRQGDHLWAVARGLCLTLYWFDPLVWLAARLSRDDSELSCDERAVAALGEAEGPAYGRTLLALVRARKTTAPGCAATMMTSGGLRERIALIAKGPHTGKAAFAAVAAGLALLAGCAFTGARELSADEALSALGESVRYESGSVSFTLPARGPAEGWSVLVNGRTADGPGGGMSVHLFENTDWQAGESYSVDLTAGYTELWLTATLPEASAPLEVDLLAAADGGPVTAAVPDGWKWVSIETPLTGGESAYQSVVARLLLPEDWQLRIDDGDPAHHIASLPYQAGIWDGETFVAAVTVSGYEPTPAAEIPDGDEWKTVFYELRLSSSEVWGDFVPMASSQNGETGTAAVTYKDESWRAQHPGTDNAAVPELTTTGLLCYDRTLPAWLALRLDPAVSLSDSDLATLAESLTLSGGTGADWSYGPTGRRYPGSFSEQYDLSGLHLTDAAGSDITGIAVDLWYCASAAYNVDDTVLFPDGSYEMLRDDMPMFYELNDYEATIGSIFTPEARAAFEASEVTRITRTADGRVWRLGPWRTGYAYELALSGLEPVSSAPGRVTLRAWYETNAGGIERDTDPAYVPHYRPVNFTLEQVDGIWYVAEYTYPETAFSAEYAAALQAVTEAIQAAYPGAVVDSDLLLEDSAAGEDRDFLLEVDFSVGTTGYQGTRWTARRRDGNWQAAAAE